MCCHADTKCTCPKKAVPRARRRSQGSRSPVLTEIERIVDFRHAHAPAINYFKELPVGSGGEFLVRWRGVPEPEWCRVDDVMEHGELAAEEYFEGVRARKQAAHGERFMQTITHIASLDDITADGIHEETETHYKLKIGNLSAGFIDELNHPRWSKSINRLFDVVREGDCLFVWADRFQVQYVFRESCEEWAVHKRLLAAAARMPGGGANMLFARPLPSGGAAYSSADGATTYDSSSAFSAALMKKSSATSSAMTSDTSSTSSSSDEDEDLHHKADSDEIDVCN